MEQRVNCTSDKYANAFTLAKSTFLFCGIDLTLYQTTFDLSKSKVMADNNSRIVQVSRYVLNRIKNIVEKRRKCWLSGFYPIPTMFEKGLFFNPLPDDKF